MKFKALQDVKFPKFDIDVKEGKQFNLTEEQYKEVELFEGNRFEVAKKASTKKKKEELKVEEPKTEE